MLSFIWRDVDLDSASIFVSQVLYKREGICLFEEPKNEHSRRRLAISPLLAISLRQCRFENEKEHFLLGKPLVDDDLVFSGAEGQTLDPGTFIHRFARVARKSGLQRTRFHDLWHTFATLMLLGGAHPKIVCEMPGHLSVAFTLDTYSYVIPTVQ